MATQKDPRRQLQGKINKDRGKRFEELLDASFGYYRERGFAHVEKTPEPMKPIKSLGNQKFIAYFERRAQPDYKGVVNGGREVVFEAKFTSTDRLEQSKVLPHQAECMRRHQALKARCYVLAGFSSGNVYKIPWDVWDNMKQHFGRKYVKEEDLKQYTVPVAWNGVLMLFGAGERS